MIKAAIFDMDGVIVDTEPFHRQSESQTMKKHGVNMPPDEFLKYSGTTVESMFEALIKIHKIDADARQMTDEKTKLVLKILHNNTQTMSGVKEFIEGLKRKKIKIALATSSKKDFVDFILKEIKMEKTFDAIVTADDVTHSKPNPEVFLKAAAKLKVNPADCLVVEDSKSGVEAGKAAGMKVLGYQSGEQDLSKADVVVNDFAEAMQLVP